MLRQFHGSIFDGVLKKLLVSGSYGHSIDAGFPVCGGMPGFVFTG